jgi:hypothetical protein
MAVKENRLRASRLRTARPLIWNWKSSGSAAAMSSSAGRMKNSEIE